jgi:hypothetical protein
MSTGRLGAGDTAIQPTIFDAKADILTATAADTPARLAVGSNNQVLTADSSTATGLKWATPTAISWVKLASGSFGNVAAVNIDNVFTASYKHYVITLDNVSGNAAANLQFNFRKTDSTTYSTNYYGGTLKLTYNSSTPTNIQHNAVGQATISEELAYGAGILFITASTTSATYPAVQGFYNSHNNAIATAPMVTTDAINAGGVRFSVDAGTLTGNYIIYGVTE